jgi:hypothetical protein
MQIRPSALVESGARLGSACIIHTYAVIRRHCVLGDGVVVHPFAVVGGDPQDLGFEVTTDSTVQPELRPNSRVENGHPAQWEAKVFSRTARNSESRFHCG